MEILRQRGVRLIAINDNVDTDRGDNDMTPFLNIMYEFYARHVDGGHLDFISGQAAGNLKRPIALQCHSVDTPYHVSGLAEAIIVKDMSRLGRDYLKVGQVMEILRQRGRGNRP